VTLIAKLFEFPRTRTIIACTTAAVGLLATACSSGGGSAGASMTPRQALLAAATQTRQLRSGTATVTVHTSGNQNETTTANVQLRLKPALEVGEGLTLAAGGTTTQVNAVLTGSVMYLHEASLTSQLGKPWLEIPLSALNGTPAAFLAPLIQSLQSNNFTSQVQLVTVAKNTRMLGKQTFDGVPTTEYAGSFTAAAGLKALPAGLRQALAPALQALGDIPISFHEWIDGQHYLRKMIEVEMVNGNTVTITEKVTAINQPVHITLPPASQTLIMPGSGPASGGSGDAGLAAKAVPAPAGFTLSQSAGAPNGSLSATDFNQITGGGNSAASLHFARGYHAAYDSDSNGDSIQVFLFQFATPADATTFKASSVSVAPGKPKDDLFIPGAEDYDSTSPTQGMYDHGVIGINGSYVFVIDEATGSAAPVPLVGEMARQQYAAL
jgi:hypothetical protein